MSVKKILALVILVVGLATSVFVISNPREKRLKSDGAFNISAAAENKNPLLNFQLAARLGQSATIRDLETTERNNNLTNRLANLYTQKITAGDSGTKIATEDVINQITGQTMLKYQIFNLSDIKTKSDNSSEVQKKYFEEVDDALIKNFSWLKKNIITMLDEFTKQGKSADFNKLIETIPEFINNLLQIEPPKKLDILHLQLLNLWQKKLTSYQAIRETESDPLNAYLALKEIPKIIQEDIDLQKIMLDYYNELTKANP